MAAIFFGAVFLLFFARAQQYQLLRRQGQSTEGRWIDSFVQLRTEHFETIYRFELGDKSYPGRQRVAPSEYGGDGLGLAISLAGLILSLQHDLYLLSRTTILGFSLRRLLLRPN